jgi:hypothetical protein
MEYLGRTISCKITENALQQVQVLILMLQKFACHQAEMQGKKVE